MQMICIWFRLSCCHCHLIISCFIKIQNGLPFWCRLTQVVLENRPLNGSVCVRVCDCWDQAEKQTLFYLPYAVLYNNLILLLHSFNGLFARTTWVSQHQKGKPFWILLKQEMMGGSGISWTICKSFASHCRQITTPVPHYSIFLWARCSSWCPTISVKALKAVETQLQQKTTKSCMAYQMAQIPKTLSELQGHFSYYDWQNMICSPTAIAELLVESIVSSAANVNKHPWSIKVRASWLYGCMYGLKTDSSPACLQF